MEDWVSEVVEHLRSRDGADGSSLQIFEALAASKECSVVWTAIEKRLGDAEAIHERAMRRIAREGEINEESLRRWVKKDLREEAENLADTIELALSDQRFCDAATVSQRKNVKERFTKAAQSMIEVLRLLERGDYGVDEVDRRLSAMTCEAAKQACNSLAERSDTSNISYLIARNTRTVAEFVALACAGDPIQIIEAMRDGVNEWADTPPLIPRPDAINARRLRLIRELSDHFKSRYGTPLRSSVLAITGVFFDCEGLDESTIAKLAP